MMIMIMIMFGSLSYFELSSLGAICLYADLPNITSSPRWLPGVIDDEGADDDDDDDDGDDDEMMMMMMIMMTRWLPGVIAL